MRRTYKGPTCLQRSFDSFQQFLEGFFFLLFFIYSSFTVPTYVQDLSQFFSTSFFLFHPGLLKETRLQGPLEFSPLQSNQRTMVLSKVPFGDFFKNFPTEWY